MTDFVSESRDGMRIDWDVPIRVDDGLGPYGKWLHFEDLDVEIWPTSIVAPAGYRIGLTVRGRDYEYPGGPSPGLGTLGAVFTGIGPFQHDDPRDRPAGIFGKKVTIHCGPGWQSYVLLPVIPPAR